MKRLILLGPPGCGKGTQASKVAAAQGIIAISSGNMFRDAIRTGAAVGLEAQRYMEAGNLVPDAITIRLVTERLEQPDCAGGFLLDGFPRTLPQAQALGEAVAIEGVLEIKCRDETIISRLAGRRVHPGSGRVYHVKHNPPRREGLDDITGEPLEQRDDDLPETIAKRLQVYAEQTSPLTSYYAAGGPGMPTHYEVDGDRDIAQVSADLLAALS